MYAMIVSPYSTITLTIIIILYTKLKLNFPAFVFVLCVHDIHEQTAGADTKMAHTWLWLMNESV